MWWSQDFNTFIQYNTFIGAVDNIEYISERKNVFNLYSGRFENIYLKSLCLIVIIKPFIIVRVCNIFTKELREILRPKASSYS